ncbi:surfeit locus 1 family protein (plasmid) [Rhizobium gallicum bv. gallicum R602sp]|uniref:SURF1-like protein n=1 Tax=Rhizobium gallicum bv. gallicum R602sp TaxID=1041138 RepID=A0A0B4XCK6_9HYPH|nr:surfeit locus 1 family protein [Rhizobium gallicum bv. gallicum R602sp]TDW33490.1 surfeit locus 1 family protein [Rhizobium azibense]
MPDSFPLPKERRRPSIRLAMLCSLMLLSMAGFVALGLWQVERLSWKRDLIARIDQRVHAEPAPAPTGRAVHAADDEYRRVTATGTLQNSKETLVYASTELGPGFWVMTPLSLREGQTVLINRGFVPTDRRDPQTRPSGQLSGQVTITGLMRITEPKGSLLQSNDPASGRWYSRDVAAIAAEKHVADAAEYFIDADNTPNPGGLPIGGLTRIVFANNHLVYAITWFGLALMVAGLLGFVIRSEVRTHWPWQSSG